MTISEIIQLLVDNGLAVFCVGYLIYFQHTTMTKMLETLGNIDKRLAIIEDKMEREAS